MCHSPEPPKSRAYTPSPKTKGVTQKSRVQPPPPASWGTALATAQTNQPPQKFEAERKLLFFFSLVYLEEKDLRFPLHLRQAHLENKVHFTNICQIKPFVVKQTEDHHHSTWTQTNLPRCSSTPKLRLLSATGNLRLPGLCQSPALNTQTLLCSFPEDAVNSCNRHSKLFRHVHWEKRANQIIQMTIKIKLLGFFRTVKFN